jgi:hemerythrin-like domain-containing protein
MSIDNPAAQIARPDTSGMVAVHNVFRRLFGDLPWLVEDVATDDIARAAVLGDLFDELAAALHRHHTGEDELLWPTLLGRLDVDRGLVLRAEEQHERVHDLLERARRQLAEFRSTASAEARTEVAATLTELDAVLCEHMADEERDILPLVEQHLTVPEWDALGDRSRASVPKDRLLIQLGWMLDGLPAARRRELLGTLPLGARLAWRLVGRRAWELELARVYDAHD